MTHPGQPFLAPAPALDHDAARLYQILDALPQPVMLFRPDGGVDYANAAAQRQYGLPLPDVDCHRYAHHRDGCTPQPDCPVQQALHTRQAISGERQQQDPHGRVRHLEVSVTPLFAADGSISGLLETHHDITERKLEEQRLQLLQGQLTELAHRDPLTNLSNRRFLELRLDSLARERSPRPCALLFADLDHFKPLNDVHGHVLGDQALSQIAQRLRGAVRTSDLLVRVGGDEFAVLLEGSNEAGARAVTNKLIAALATPLHGLPPPNRVGVSVGIALFTTGTAMPHDVLQQADSAMYRAKRRGGNDRELVKL